jgi:hypothetical protein
MKTISKVTKSQGMRRKSKDNATIIADKARGVSQNVTHEDKKNGSPTETQVG